MFNIDFIAWEQVVTFAAAWGIVWLGLLWLSLVIWTYHDVRSRSQNVFSLTISVILVLVFFIPGLCLYLILRPPNTIEELYQKTLEEEALLQTIEESHHCPGCNRKIKETWLLCPNCFTTLRKKCLTCGSLLELSWNVCPNCATTLDETRNNKENKLQHEETTKPTDDSWSDFDIIQIKETLDGK